MTTPAPSSRRFENLVRGIANLIARGEYAVVQRLSGGVRLSAGDIAAAVAEHGRQVVEPPADATLVRSADAVPGASPPAWAVTASLWTAEEGRSGLALHLILREVAPAGYQVEIEGLDAR